METIIKQLNTIFDDVLETNGVNLKPETTANDIEEWDSLNHIQLVFAIEKHFKIKFNAKEIQSWKNIGDICSTIFAKL